VRTQEGLTTAFASKLGVKQGCPLSPTLFGLFIDQVEDFLHDHMRSKTSVRVGWRRVLILLYADDIVLMTTTEFELQRLVDSLALFCHNQGLVVNLTKTNTVTFTGGRVDSQPLTQTTYAGHAVPQVDSYKYLGVVFHWKLGSVLGGQAILQSARNALFALHRTARAEEIVAPVMLCTMFDTALHIASYCGRNYENSCLACTVSLLHNMTNPSARSRADVNHT
jgi:hypothetical protein